MEIFKKISIAVGFAALSWFCVAPFASAASLSFSSAANSYPVGTTFAVKLLVSSSDQAMNAAQGTISFSPATVSLLSVSKTSSIFSLWPQEPTFSNASGTADFAGVVLTPGFAGSAGTVITLNFKAIATGQARVAIASAQVLANDGNGTDILTSSTPKTITITAALPNTPAPEVPPPATVAPEISSYTHPDQTRWYANANPSFSWNVPADTKAVRILYNTFPDTAPSVSYSPPISQKDLQNLPDGVYYFHVRFVTAGGLSPTGTFKFQIDTQKPSQFAITEIPRQDTTDPVASFTFTATDATSGIDHYNVSIDNGPVQSWIDDGSHTYKTPIMAPGSHTLSARAVDKAGNFLAASANFFVTALQPPTITDYTQQLESGQTLTINGTTYPLSTVTIWFKLNNTYTKLFKVTSDQSGQFHFITNEPFGAGNYAVILNVVDSRGARSGDTSPITISVTRSFFSMAYNWMTTVFPIFDVPLALFLMLLLLVADIIKRDRDKKRK